MPGEGRIFSYEEALATFPRVRLLTEQAVQRIEAMINRLQSGQDLEERKEELDEAVQRIVQAWATEIMALGCEIKGMWLVDWDSGDGYYCWKYPEETLGHYHSYEDGFAGRVPIA
ncbi:MAG: DUF2203 domain-containing protein [Thermoanaerobaculia bacterium]